ncbi:hypothetical protein [Aequorivita antarctica]|uniref:Uncharacterized protein n=1 Tax=Aequorivita antarctica TaxID=153266 RepID=A0A5C6YW07_9FLAO|nr:hypothetical protein [Aequorivita antarctica]TXD71376.1 hypothetical protein ESU54_17175 [Aequorivita antarctica]
MKNNHLTDENLQAFLLNEIQDVAINNHITECSICSTKLENYRHLMGQINEITPEKFSFDVTTVVMHKIEKYAVQENIKRDLIFWSTMAALMGSIVLLSLPFLQPMVSVFYAKSFFTNLFIIGTGLFVVIFFVADIYKLNNAKEKILFDNN